MSVNESKHQILPYKLADPTATGVYSIVDGKAVSTDNTNIVDVQTSDFPLAFESDSLTKRNHRPFRTLFLRT